jgi:hypothetical protein
VQHPEQVLEAHEEWVNGVEQHSCGAHLWWLCHERKSLGPMAERKMLKKMQKAEWNLCALE